jgi:DNA-binding IclR family transcriptional regulator
VDSLFHEFGETVVALALINNKSQVVLWRQSSHSLAVIAPDARGVIAAPHHLAGGRVVLAYAEQAFRELYLKTIHFPENGKNLFRNEEEFLAEMERIQNQGYAVTENVIDSGIGAMSAPIFFKNGDFAMSLACSMPLSRFGGERKKQILKSLLEISEKSRL